MAEFSVGDRVLVPGVVKHVYEDGTAQVIMPDFKDGQRKFLSYFKRADLRPDTGGRDLTAQDVLAALGESDVFREGYTPVAEYLSRIARAPRPSGAGDDWCPGTSDGQHRWGTGRSRNECDECDAPRPSGADDERPAQCDGCGRVGTIFYVMAEDRARCRECGEEVPRGTGPRVGDTAPAADEVGPVDGTASSGGPVVTWGYLEQCPTSCDGVRARMEQVQRENARLINELVRVRSEAARDERIPSASELAAPVDDEDGGKTT